MSAPREPTEARIDDLRRRLYRADVTEEDRRRYLDLIAEAGDARQAEGTSPGPVRSPRRRIAAGIATGAVLIGALATAVAVQLPHPSAAPPAPSPSPSVSPFFPGLSSGVVDIGDGDLLPVGAQPPSGPTSVAASVDGLAVVGERFEGYGNAVVAFDPPPDAWDGGRISVAVTSARPSSTAWRSLLVVTRTDWSSYPLVVASGLAEDPSGAHAPTVFGYPDRPPTKVAIEAPVGVGWTLVVAATGAQGGVLR